LNCYFPAQESLCKGTFSYMQAFLFSKYMSILQKQSGLPGVLSRLSAIGKGEMRQQALARVMTWDKSRLSHQLTRMQQRGLVERRYASGNTVLVVLTKLGREKLEAARPIHAESVRRNLLSRLTLEQVDTILRVSNLLGEEA
jgi:DNA-binding MarR family transcriptional regulator